MPTILLQDGLTPRVGEERVLTLPRERYREVGVAHMVVLQVPGVRAAQDSPRRNPLAPKRGQGHQLVRQLLEHSERSLECLEHMETQAFPG